MKKIIEFTIKFIGMIVVGAIFYMFFDGSFKDFLIAYICGLLMSELIGKLFPNLNKNNI